MSAGIATATAAVKPVGPDFCLVQLTAAGASLAGAGTLRYSNGRQSFVFTPGQPLKVAKYEWDLALSVHTTADGKDLFEVVPTVTAADAAAAVAAIAGTLSSAAEAELESLVSTMKQDKAAEEKT